MSTARSRAGSISRKHTRNTSQYASSSPYLSPPVAKMPARRLPAAHPKEPKDASVPKGSPVSLLLASRGGVRAPIPSPARALTPTKERLLWAGMWSR